MLISEIKKVDLVLFTVGSSDVQLEMNKVLKNKKCTAKVVYTWLEAGGENSHVLVIDYSKKGCFQCLFTDRNGGLINNKVNKNSDVEVYKIRNGCGGTRVAYGNAVLLRTTAVLLDVIRKVFEMPESLNKLIDITPISVMDMEDMFVERKCGCCGDENNK